MNRTLRRACRIAAIVCLAAPWCSTHRSAAAPAEVEPATHEILTSIDNGFLLEIMHDEGYTADVNDKGVVIWKVEGYRAQVFISKNGGDNMQFHTAFGDSNATAAKVNRWNATKRYSKTYLDDDGDPHLELDLDLDGGVTRARIVDYLRTCRQSFDVWRREVLE